MATVTINVTAEHIANGRRRKCGACPVALALNEATGLSWSVHDSYATVPSHEMLWDLPDVVCTFVLKFDERRPVEPFAFELPVKFAGKAAPAK